mgnify:CR=1 FL=1
MISVNAVQDIASTSGKEATEEDEIWKQLTEYCNVAERLAVLRTLQVERKLLASHTHIDTLRKVRVGTRNEYSPCYHCILCTLCTAQHCIHIVPCS